MTQKNLISALLSIILACFFTACGNSATDQLESSNFTNTLNPDSNSIMIDHYGQKLIINQTPQKVLTLGPNCTELFAALGLEDYVIGRSLVNHSRGPLEEYADAVNSIPELNHASATREAILTSGADFIYTLDWEIGEQGCNIEEANTYGINVYVNSATTIEEQYQEILDIGKIFGVEDRANALIEDQKNRIQTIQDKIKETTPVRVLVYDSGNDGVFTCSGSNFESVLLETAGGENIFHDITDKQWITVSYEEVFARNPEFIIIHDYDSPSIEEKIQEIKQNPILSQLDCVKNSRFLTIPLESVLPGNRTAYTVEQFASGFYPEIFIE